MCVCVCACVCVCVCVCVCACVCVYVFSLGASQALHNLKEIGFDEAAIITALKATNNNQEQAVRQCVWRVIFLPR